MAGQGLQPLTPSNLPVVLQMLDEAFELAKALAKNNPGWVYIPPFDDPLIWYVEPSPRVQVALEKGEVSRGRKGASKGLSWAGDRYGPTRGPWEPVWIPNQNYSTCGRACWGLYTNCHRSGLPQTLVELLSGGVLSCHSCKQLQWPEKALG